MNFLDCCVHYSQLRTFRWATQGLVLLLHGLDMFIDVKNNVYSLDDTAETYVMGDLGHGPTSMRARIQKVRCSG